MNRAIANDATRRLALLAPMLTFAVSSVDASVPAINGYASKQSVRQGESIEFHVSTSAAAFDLHIYRQGASLVPMGSVEMVPGSEYAVPDSAYWYGCDWPAAYVLDVPLDWPSGVYLAEFVVPSDSQWSVFVVRENQPGSVSPILFTTCETTWQAYNNWGGKSLYSGNSGGVKSAKVSFDRPYEQWSGQGHFYRHGAAQFIIWAESEGYELEYAAGTDLHRDPELLSNYSVYLSVGHDEYWSYEMREQLEAFRDSGQSIGFFSANSIYWQVRFENDVRRMVCYRSIFTDPLFGADPKRTTVRWRDFPVKRPEAALIGVQYMGGRCGSTGACDPAGQPAAIAEPDHWVFQGTGLGPGDSLGTVILHWEWDRTVEGITPEPVEVVLEAWPVDSNGNPSLYQGVYFHNGGKIFAGGTVAWGLGLAHAEGWGYSDADVQQVTDNVLEDLLEPLSATFAPEGAMATSPPFAIVVAPNPTRAVLSLELNVPRPLMEVSFELYDVHGRLVIRYPPSHMPAGAHALTLNLRPNGKALASGTYFLRPDLPGAKATKVVVIR